VTEEDNNPSGDQSTGVNVPPPPAQAPYAEQAGEHRAELIALLDEISESIANARAMPMSSSVLVNRDEINSLVNRAQKALPAELATADAILSDADEVLKKAQKNREEMLVAARSEVEQMVSKESVVKKAEKRAEKIIAEAQEEARKLAKSTDDWCDRRLAQVEIDVESLIQNIRAGRARLAERMGQVPPGTAEHLGE